MEHQIKVTDERVPHSNHITIMSFIVGTRSVQIVGVWCVWLQSADATKATIEISKMPANIFLSRNHVFHCWRCHACQTLAPIRHKDILAVSNCNCTGKGTIYRKTDVIRASLFWKTLAQYNRKRFVNTKRLIYLLWIYKSLSDLTIKRWNPYRIDNYWMSFYQWVSNSFIIITRRLYLNIWIIDKGKLDSIFYRGINGWFKRFGTWKWVPSTHLSPDP